MRFVARAVTLGALFAACACSLLVDTSELDAQCGSGMKACNGECVGVDEPFYGCTQSGCLPCGGDHIVHRCEDFECAFLECQHGWGCENCATNLLTTSSRCGACDNACAKGSTCSDGECVDANGVRTPPDGGGGGGGAGGEGGGASGG